MHWWGPGEGMEQDRWPVLINNLVMFSVEENEENGEQEADNEVDEEEEEGGEEEEEEEEGDGE